jgi:hypothetical protein
MNNYWCCKNAGGENTGFYLGLARARDYVDSSANSIDVLGPSSDTGTAGPGLAPHSVPRGRQVNLPSAAAAAPTAPSPARVAAAPAVRAARSPVTAAAVPPAVRPSVPAAPSLRTIRISETGHGGRPAAALLACGAVVAGLASRRLRRRATGG